MAVVPPILLVLDISTLSTTTTRDWLGFSRAGVCYLPQVIYEEMRFLYDRSPDPDLERTAREFNRFYATSGWKITEVVGHHPLLKSSTGYGLTRRTRVGLAVARCAYGLAQQHPASLVVLVASDRSILQRIYDIQTPNLTAIPGSTLLNWSRTGQRPVAISQKLQQMKAAGTFHPTPLTTNIKPSTKPPTPTARGKPHSPPKRSPPAPHRRPTSRSMGSNPVDIGQLLTGLSAFAALAIAGLLIWLIFFSEGFRQFRDQSSPPDEVGRTSQPTSP
ncbi:MAG: PIN domain-containing protein [Elainellaceae cyanobacterium]